ncbi:DVU0524 family FlgM-associated protein [Desulfosarcina sp.]|uniref:DVU0524 family FlgM-associated protein n=1 Tax=Desulfosarcina sp. TaxID=2027861 RepID=UPI0035633120
MYIQSYQIHNVLNVYRRQLSLGKANHPQQVGNPDAKSDAITISKEAKNQSIMEKVAAGVFKKITNVDLGSNFGQELINQVRVTPKDLNIDQKDNTFVFNTIVKDNQKETRSIPVDNSQGLMNRLDELAKTAINRKAE